MKCSVAECSSNAHYVEACLCQKHYFRQWRYGTTALTRTRQLRVTMPGKGYQRLYEPDHPLADTQGYVGEHRKVVFSQIGFELKSCALCGKPETWETVHIDHIDQNIKNNEPSNLRPLCRPCNTFRHYPERHTFKSNHAIEFMGVTDTAKAWSRATKGYLSGSAIARRIAAGMTPEQALMTPKATHRGNAGVPYTHEGLIELARHYNAEAKKLKAAA